MTKSPFLFGILTLVITGTIVTVDATNSVVNYKITGDEIINIKPNMDEKSLTVFRTSLIDMINIEGFKN